MSDFNSLQSRHEELIKQAQKNQDVLDQAKQLIEDIKKSSSQMSSSSERDQLRANLRYWASYVYEKSGDYPNIDLAPATGQRRFNFRSFFAAIFAGLVLILFGLRYPNLFTTSQTRTPSPSSTFLQQATEVRPSQTPTRLPTFTPTIVDATQPGAISIEITSVHDGDEVSPITPLSGTYSNLPPGYSIHLIVQPVSKDELQFPMKQFATVSPNSSTGTWTIEGKFGQGEDLKTQEEYRVYMVAAIDEVARQALIEASETGFQRLPSGVVPFPQTIKVSRAAYADFIDEVRLIYSSFLDDEFNYEIFTAKTDGLDSRRVTYTSGVNELFPNLSPDGTKMVYVGETQNENRNLVYSVDVINSDGTSIRTIVPIKDRLVYEKPLWSTDGRYIVYSVGTPQGNAGPTFWNIYVYDFQDGQSFMITEGNTTSHRYFSWIPNTHQIVFDERMPQTGTSGFMKVDIGDPHAISPYFDLEEKEEVQPAVSPDGKFLAYMQKDGKTGNIYVVNLTTKVVTQLTQGEFQDLYPVWSPDSKTIFFDSAETAFITVWSVNIDGTNLTQLTFGKDRFPFVGHMYALIPK